MALAVVAQASLTLTSSEQSVGGAVTTGKTAVLQLDLNTMANADWITLNCYLKTAGTGDTAKIFFTEVFTDSQSGSPVYQSIPVAGMYSVEFKMLTSAGTNRTIPYVLLTID